MKVKDLIKKLNAYDSNSEVLCYTEDDSGLDKDHLFKLFVIENLDVSEGEPQKGDNYPNTGGLRLFTRAEVNGMV